MSIASALRVLTAALTACLLLPVGAPAADGERTPLGLEGSEPARTVADGGAGGGLVRTIVGLAIVLGVIYGLHWVLKQVRAAREPDVSGNGLRSLATLPLGPNRALHLVRAGDEVVLLGVGEGGVTPVRTYSEPEARALGLLGEPEPEPEPEPDAARSPDAARRLGRDADASLAGLDDLPPWEAAPAPARPVPVAALAASVALPGATATATATARPGVKHLVAELRRRTVR